MIFSPRRTLSASKVFPITHNQDGQLITHLPNTGLVTAGTIQGEGKLAGTSTLFIRLATCNLRCVWQTITGDISPCDTPYASFQIDNPITYTVAEIISILSHNLGIIHHIVISGGEPFLQAQELAELCKAIKTEFNVHLTIETNGTIMSAEVLQYIDLISVSPKLSSSNPTPEKLSVLNIESKGAFKLHSRTRINIEVLSQLIMFSVTNGKDIQFKFVVSSVEDEVEIKELLAELPKLHLSDILLMPLGGNSRQMDEVRKLTLEMVVRNGWRFSPRLHIDIFGSKEGV